MFNGVIYYFAMLQEKLNIFLRVPVSVSRILRFIALIKSKLNIGMRNVSDKEEKNNPDNTAVSTVI